MQFEKRKIVADNKNFADAIAKKFILICSTARGSFTEYTHHNYNCENMIEVVQETFYNEVIENMKRLEEENRHYNFYHGFTKLQLPYVSHQSYNDDFYDKLYFFIATSASSGSIRTQYFGEKLDLKNVVFKVLPDF